MQKTTLHWWSLLVVLILLGACSPPTNELPTLVRIPTDPQSATEPVVAQSQLTLPASFTPTFTPTITPTPDSSVTASASPTITITPSATITDTATPTPTSPPPLTGDDRPLIAFLLTAVAQATVLPENYQVPNFGGPDVTLIPVDTPTLPPGFPTAIPALPTSGLPIAGSCSTQTTGGFLPLYQGNPDIANQLGCPSGGIQTIPAASQNFEGGIMIWLNGEILILYSNGDTFQSLPDTYVDGSDPETSSEVAPTGLFTPIRGFLKIWSGNSVVRNGLGWATTIENGTTATVQSFTNGRMIYLPGRTDILILIGVPAGTWLTFQGSY